MSSSKIAVGDSVVNSIKSSSEPAGGTVVTAASSVKSNSKNVATITTLSKTIVSDEDVITLSHTGFNGKSVWVVDQ